MDDKMNKESNKNDHQNLWKIIKKSSKMDAKILQNRSLEVSWEGLGAILAPSWCFEPILAPTLGGLGPILAPRWGFGAPSWLPNESQNPWKLLPRAIQKVTIFLIDLKIDFWSDLVPTWLYLDPQNPPKIEVSWHSNPSKLGHGFNFCFLQDVGSNFIDF